MLLTFALHSLQATMAMWRSCSARRGVDDDTAHYTSTVGHPHVVGRERRYLTFLVALHCGYPEHPQN